MKRCIVALLLLVLAGLTAAHFVVQDARRALQLPLRLTQKLDVELRPGTGLAAVTVQFERLGLSPHPRLGLYLQVYGRYSGLAGALKAGEYELVPGMSSLDALNLFVSGRVVLHELKLIEGWTAQQALRAVREHPKLVHTLAEGDAAQLMEAIGRPGQHPEGRFFPDTYRFPKGTTDVAFLRRAAAALDNALQQEWEQREPGLPLQSAEEALVLASIVEKETGVPSERSMVAGVFVNRLRIGMRLQTDPTVIYGLGAAFDGNIRRKDLTTDTPYNTYTRSGLPPTPICLPGRAAIRAALHPAQTRALFFVSRGDGTHSFSETLQAHNSAVYQFQKKIRKPSDEQRKAQNAAKPRKKKAR